MKRKADGADGVRWQHMLANDGIWRQIAQMALDGGRRRKWWAIGGRWWRFRLIQVRTDVKINGRNTKA